MGIQDKRNHTCKALEVGEKSHSVWGRRSMLLDCEVKRLILRLDKQGKGYLSSRENHRESSIDNHIVR